MPVGMGKYLQRNIKQAVATFYPQEGHHFVYERWREILAVIVAETQGPSRPRPRVDRSDRQAGEAAQMPAPGARTS